MQNSLLQLMRETCTFPVNEEVTANDEPSALGSFGVKRKKKSKEKKSKKKKKKSRNSDGENDFEDEDSQDSDYC